MAWPQLNLPNCWCPCSFYGLFPVEGLPQRSASQVQIESKDHLLATNKMISTSSLLKPLHISEAIPDLTRQPIPSSVGKCEFRIRVDISNLNEK